MYTFVFSHVSALHQFVDPVARLLFVHRLGPDLLVPNPRNRGLAVAVNRAFQRLLHEKRQGVNDGQELLYIALVSFSRRLAVACARLSSRSNT